MDIQLTMQRIQNARRAMVRAQNPWFRNYWNDVANTLQEKLVEKYGQALIDRARIRANRTIIC